MPRHPRVSAFVFAFVFGLFGCGQKSEMVSAEEYARRTTMEYNLAFADHGDLLLLKNGALCLVTSTPTRGQLIRVRCRDFEERKYRHDIAPYVEDIVSTNEQRYAQLVVKYMRQR